MRYREAEHSADIPSLTDRSFVIRFPPMVEKAEQPNPAVLRSQIAGLRAELARLEAQVDKIEPKTEPPPTPPSPVTPQPTPLVALTDYPGPLKPKAIEELKEIYRRKEGRVLSNNEARAIGDRLIRFLFVLCRR